MTDRHRLLLLFATAACLTGLLLHPSVPAVYKAVRGSLPLMPARDFGYPAHVAAYLTFGALAARLTRVQTPRGGWLLIGGLALHGVTSETLQLGVAGRTFDPGDMACNLLSAAAGVRLATRTAEPAAAV